MANPDPVRPGGVLVYEATVTNTGTGMLDDVLVSLVLPNFAGTARGISHDGAVSSGTARWNMDGLQPLESRTVQLTLPISGSAPAGTTLSSVVSASAPGGADDSVVVTAKVTSGHPLSVAIAESADPVLPDAPLTYSLTFGNAGVAPLVGATLTAPIPAGTTVTDVSHDGQVSGGLITWPLGVLDPGIHAQRTFTVTVDDLGVAEPGTRRATAILAAGSVEGRATALTTIEPAPLLRLDALATPDPVAADGILTFQLTVTNLDAITRAGVTLVLPIPDLDPDCVNVSPATSCSDTPGTFVSWPLGSLPAGASRTVTLTTYANDANTGLSFADGTVVGTHAFVSDVIGANARATVAVALDDAQPLQLSLAESADPIPPGAPLTYTATFGNAGASPVIDAVMTAPIPPATTVTAVSHGGTVAAGHITWPLGILDPGAHGQRTFTVTVDDLGAGEPGTRRATATLATTAAESRATALTTVEFAPTLRLDALATPDPVAADGVLTYQLTVTNLGAISRAGVTLVLPIPDVDPDCVEATPASCSDNPGAFVSWPLGSLPAGAARTVTLTTYANDANTGVSFADGTVAATHAFVSDAAGASARATVAVVLDDAQPLQLSLTELADPVIPGASLTYIATFGNAGASPAIDAVLTAPIPSATTVTAVSHGGTVAAGLITWPLGNLEPGAHGQRTFTVTVDDLGVAEPGTRRATATVAADGAEGRATALTTVESAPVLRLDALATPDPVVADGILTYQFTVTNLDAISRAGVTIVLPMPDIDPDCVQATPASCFDSPGRFVSWPLGSLPAGATRTVTVTTYANDANTGSSFADGTVAATHAFVTDATGANARATVAVVLADAQPLQLSLTESADPVLPGAPLTYTLTFGNAGASPVIDAVITVPIPPATTVTAVSHGGTVTDGLITWPLDTLPPGTHGQRFFSVTVDELGAAEPGTRRAAATLATATAVSRATALTTVEPAPTFRLDAVATPDPIAADGIITFQITVTNLDTIAHAGVTVVLPMPDIDPDCVETTPETSCSDVPGAFITWSLGSVPAGASRIVTLTTYANDASTGRSVADGTVVSTHAFVGDVTGANARATVAVRLES